MDKHSKRSQMNRHPHHRRGQRVSLSCMAVLMMGSACRQQFTSPSVDLMVQLDPEFQLVADVSFESPPPGFEVASYRYDWYLEGRLMEDIHTPFVEESALTYSQTWRVEVTPVDADGKLGHVGTAELHLAAAPTLEVAVGPTEATTKDRLEAFILITGGFISDPTYDIRWFVDDVPVPEYDDVKRVPAWRTSRDEEWRVELHALDPWSAIPPTASVTIKNTPPVMRDATLYPSRPMTESVIQAQATTADLDADNVTLSYVWSVNGVEVPGETGPTLDGKEYFDRDDTVKVVIRADDGTDYVEQELETTVYNSPPQAPILDVPEAPVIEGEPFHCAVQGDAYDADGDAVTYEVVWSVRGVPLMGTETIALDDDSVPEGLSEAGTRYVCQVIPHDGLEQGSPGVVSVPVSLPYIAVGAGDLHSCAVTDAEALECDGDNSFGQSSSPNGRFTNVATGLAHSCGLRIDGQAVCFGSNLSGQLDSPDVSFSSLDAGSYHTCGISDLGETYCWGQDGSGQADVPLDREFTQVSAGAFHTCGVTVDHEAVCWGWQDMGQADVPEYGFEYVSAGFLHSCGVALSGNIHCWGDNSAGQLDAPRGRSFVKVGAGDEFSCGLTEGGVVRCWGSNSHGQLNGPNLAFKDLSVGSRHACGITGNDIAVCWGDPSAGPSVFIPNP